MPSGIFISYRRQDSQMAAGRLADCIKEEFGDAEIFRDVENIDPGADFVEVLGKALNACVVMLVVIGPQWLTIQDKSGRRRLDVPGDWTRVEVSTALQRNIRVIPVLLEDTPMPEESELPADLAKLAQRQALEVSDKRWAADTEKLMETLARIPGLARRQATAPTPPEKDPDVIEQIRKPIDSAVGRVKKVFMWIGGIMVGLVVLGLFVEEEQPAAPPEPPAVSPAPVIAPPAPGPAPRRSAAPPVATPALPNLAGPWHARSGESYSFTQQGTALTFSIMVDNNPVGQGFGSLEDGTASLVMNVLFGGQQVTMACEMQLAPDHRAMTGTCANSMNGQVTQAQIFR